MALFIEKAQRHLNYLHRYQNDDHKIASIK